MSSKMSHFIAFLFPFFLHTQAYPLTQNNKDTFMQSTLNNVQQQGLLTVNSDPDNQNDLTSIPSHSDTNSVHSPNFRVDEAALAEYTAHSQAEDDGGSNSGGLRISLLPTQVKTAESVNFEKEGIPSKIFSAYDNTQKKVIDVSNLEPIVDTISEHEKYGNNGDMFDGIARTIVNGYEAFSNLLNTFIQKPKDIARSISKGITAQLDIIGGKIVGL